jgi:hypothetical protein
MKSAAYTAARKSGTLIFCIYAGFVVSNYLTVLLTGRYTGDFIGVPPQLSGAVLFLNFLYTLAPLTVLYLMYRHYARRITRRKITVPVRVLQTYLLIALPFSILVSLRYGVGNMTSDGTYSVPMALRLIIIFINRLDPYFGTYLYSVIVPPRNKLKYLFMLMLIVLSLTRASLNAFVLIVMVNILIYNRGNYLKFIKKRIFLLLLVIVLAPLAVSRLYDFRESLRGSSSSTANFSPETLIFGKLIGRLSSYTNSALLLDRKDTIIPRVKENITFFEFPLEASPFPRPFSIFRYAHVLVGRTGNVFFSPGTSGIMTIGFYHSPLTLCINLITVWALLSLAFKLSTILRYPKITELWFLFLCAPVVEGGGFLRYVQSPIIFFSVFLVINFLDRWNNIYGKRA